jgi:SAM-dependent methyltransferase
MNTCEPFRCAACGGLLNASGGGASLTCAGCGSAYPVVNGIPRFVPAENYAANFGFQWNRFRRTQLDSWTGAPVSRDRFMRATGWSRDTLVGTRVLDVGCGAGRFAEIALSLGASVVAVDYSSAVDACRANLPDANLQVAQADVYGLPFAPGTFDFVYSLGVIQHTPDVEKTIAALARQVKPGGELVVDVYRRHWKGWLHPRIWLRPITTRLDPMRLFAVVERAAPALLKVSNAVGALPVAGPQLRRLVPVANYKGQLPLTPRQLEEWAILDTYDWLAPAYDQPQTAATLQRWMTDAGLIDVRVLTADHLTARGRRPGGGR